jgi:hypothetical protein
MRTATILLAAAVLVAGPVARAELPPLLADSALLDRAYIPALMLSNGKDSAKARAAHAGYEAAWQRFVAGRRTAQPAGEGWTKVLAEVDRANAKARAALDAGAMKDAHDAQEEVRHALWHERQVAKLDYQPDLLTDFHATMELIIADATARPPAAIGKAEIATLRGRLGTARAAWQQVKAAAWDPADYGLDAKRLQSYRAALDAEDRALDELAAALDAGDGARIAAAATAIKPPFARAYAAFGVFPD